ncbi:MAG TPA: rhodanese-like domain-containing protein [Lentimicrobium sp.]|nr:rhodanese-like domain-containing protein [Lentimicrobium sp.]
MEKKKSQLVIYGIASLIVAIVIITSIVIYKADIPYKLTAEQALAELNKSDNFLDPSKDIDKEAAKTVFIDVRNPLDYNFSHLKNAINIPSEKVLQEEYLDNIRELEEKGNTIIMYGSVPQEVAGPWLLLKQVGINNLKMYSGTFAQLISKEPIVPTVYNETPLIDTTLLKKTVKEPIKNPDAALPKKEVVPLKVAPAPEGGGGC